MQVEELKTEAVQLANQKQKQLEAEFDARVEKVREECLRELRSEREIQLQRCAREKIERDLRQELT